MNQKIYLEKIFARQTMKCYYRNFLFENSMWLSEFLLENPKLYL